MGAERLERKLAAIFYADVAGYSRLTGADEEGTHRTLSTYLDAITALIKDHSGKVLHYAGDAVLAEFTSVVDALNGAVAVQRDLAARNADLPDPDKLQFRIGINLGDVIVDRNEIYGDGVNVAARLESLAEPGGICISGTVYDAIGNKLPLAYTFMGKQAVKNIAQPVRAYGVVMRPESPARTKVPTARAGELRQVTVLFAGLSEFTKLSSELEPEEAHALLSRYFEVVDNMVEKYGGAVDKQIEDVVMAVFGAPIAHGNDSERAIRAAVEMHSAVTALGDEMGAPLRVHIGIASGQVMAGGGARQGYTVIGESVSLASQLREAAGPDETLVSDAVHRDVAGYADCEPMSDVVLKGLGKTVRAWRVRALLSHAAESARSAFVGRRAELAQFAGVIRTCRDTGSGQAILVRGEAGIGKTRLVEEFVRMAEQEGFTSHKSLVLDFGVGKGRGPIRALLHSLLAIPSGASDKEREAAVDAMLADGLLVPDQRPFLNDLLDLPQSTQMRAVYDAMDNATRNRGKRELVARLIQALSARQPMLLTLEDIHWADALILSHLATMTMAVRDCAAVLVMSSRIEGDPLDQTWRSSIHGSSLMTIDLAPLRKDEALALASAFLDTTSHFAMNCIERADGNPLFLEQLLRNAEESQDQAVPGSIQSLVLARMDRLSPRDKGALQTASVIGQRFSLDTVQYLLGDPDFDCSGLMAHYLVRPEEEDYLFVHALIQEGAYSSLLKARKRELHRQLSAWFTDRDPVLRAQHLDRAEDPDAARAYLEAARAQASDYRYERALQLVDRGLALTEDKPNRFALTCLRGELLQNLGLVPESIGAYQSALELAGDHADRCRAWIGLAEGMRVLDRFDEALQTLDLAETAATHQGLSLELARIHHLRGNLYFPLGRIEECTAQHELALKHAQEAQSPEAEARALGGLGDAAYARGQMITANDYFSRCVALCRRHGFGRIEVANLPMTALTRVYRCELDDGLNGLLAAIEAAHRVGHHRAELNARVCTYSVLLDIGELEQFKEQLQQAQVLVERLGARRFEPPILAFLARILRTVGRPAEGIALLEQALTICREPTMRFYGPRILSELARCTGDPDRRQQALAEGEQILRQGAVGHNHLWFYRDAIELAVNLEDWDGLDRYAAALEQYTQAEPLPWSDFFIAWGRALARHGRGERDETTRKELQRLRDEAERVGFKTALPALERALSDCSLPSTGSR